MGGLLNVPHPAAAVLLLSAELTAGLPAPHILSGLGTNSTTQVSIGLVTFCGCSISNRLRPGTCVNVEHIHYVGLFYTLIENLL